MANGGQTLPAIALAISDRSETRRWVLSIALAMLVHLAVAVMLLTDWSSTSLPLRDEAPMAAMTIELAPLPTTAKVQPSDAAPGPEQIEQQVQRKPRPKPLRFDPPPLQEAAQHSDALPKHEQPPEPQKEEAQVAVEKTTAPPSSDNTINDTAQAPVEGTPNDNSAEAIQSWHDRLLAHLEHHKRYPRAAQQRRQEDVIYLRFRINRSGVILDWSIARSRGYALLDAEVNALIQRASPLPPPPDDIGGNPIEMVMPVEFFLQRQVAGGRG